MQISKCKMKEVVDGLSQDIQIFKSKTCMNPWSEETAHVSGTCYLFQNGSKRLSQCSIDLQILFRHRTTTTQDNLDTQNLDQIIFNICLTDNKTSSYEPTWLTRDTKLPRSRYDTFTKSKETYLDKMLEQIYSTKIGTAQ